MAESPHSEVQPASRTTTTTSLRVTFTYGDDEIPFPTAEEARAMRPPEPPDPCDRWGDPW